MSPRRSPAALLLLIGLGALACSGGSSAPATGTSVPASPAVTPTVLQLSDLSLVYVDTSKGQGVDVYTAAYDGASPRKVATLPAGTRVVDVLGRSLAAISQTQLSFLDLTTGAVRSLAAQFVDDGRFLDDGSFFYVTGAGCGPPDGSKTSVVKVDVAALKASELVSPDSRNLSIIGLDPAQPAIAVVLRGCDVGVHTIGVFSLSDGKALQTLTAEGCGWAAVSWQLRRALVSWRSCSLPAGRAPADLTIYDFAGALPPRDLTAPNGGANLRPFLVRPNGAQAALATTMTSGGTAPGSTKSTGLWLLDLNTLVFTNLGLGDGAEQYPIAWSPDGRYLLAATVFAQGVCGFSYIDTTTKESKTVTKDISFCGANGDMVGWTALK